jgi:hypothetical protein
MVSLPDNKHQQVKHNSSIRKCYTFSGFSKHNEGGQFSGFSKLMKEVMDVAIPSLRGILYITPISSFDRFQY